MQTQTHPERETHMQIIKITHRGNENKPRDTSLTDITKLRLDSVSLKGFHQMGIHQSCSLRQTKQIQIQYTHQK